MQPGIRASIGPRVHKAIGRGRCGPSWPGKIGCYALTKMNFKCRNTTLMFLAKTTFAGGNGAASHRLRSCHCAAVDACLKPFGSSAAPQKTRAEGFPQCETFRGTA